MKEVIWLSLQEAANVAGCSIHTLRRLCNHAENGVPMPLLPHRRAHSDGRPASGGSRRGTIIQIEESVAMSLRGNQVK